MSNSHKVGTIIRDGDKFGIIRNVIVAGTWCEEPLFNWSTSYEIIYFDGSIHIMMKTSFDRLVESGRIEVVAK